MSGVPSDSPVLAHPHATATAALLEHLGASATSGLSAADAASRLASHGPNELPSKPPTPLWRRVLEQFRDPLVILLLVAIVISTVAWAIEGAHGAPIDSLVIAAVIILNAAIGLIQESKAASAVAALQKMTQAQATVIRDGQRTELPASQLVPGDVILLAEGDQVPADARLLRAEALRVIESSLTGESEPVTKTTAAPTPAAPTTTSAPTPAHPGAAPAPASPTPAATQTAPPSSERRVDDVGHQTAPSASPQQDTATNGTLPADTPLAERTNMVFRGTSVAQGSATALVTATGRATQMGEIALMLDSVEDAPTPLQREITQVSKVLGIVVGLIAVAVVAVMLAINGVDTPQAIIESLLLGVSLAVAAVPEGLPAILSLVLALGVRRMAAHRAVVKKLTSVETLGSASVICSDKTGTLTKSEMTIQEVVTASGATIVSGVGYLPEGDLGPDDDRDYVMDSPALTGPRRDEVTATLLGGTLASDAELARGEDGTWRILGDPTEGAFFVAEGKLALSGNDTADAPSRRAEDYTRLSSIPFTSDRKMMSVICRHEPRGQVFVFSKGAPDVLLERCTRIVRGGEVVDLDEPTRSHLLAEVSDMSGRALRTLATAYRPLSDSEAAAFDSPVHDASPAAPSDEEVESGLILTGIVGIIDPPRPEAAAAVAEALRAGVRVMMITGDHPATAGRIAADLGIAPVGARVLTGGELSLLSPAELSQAVREVSVYARVAPAHKMAIVKCLQADGETVAMTGDGVNDAPALRQADIGVAMGITGTQVTKEAGTMVLADDNFATIVSAVREGRRIFDNIRKFLRYLLSSNMGEVMTVFGGVLLAGIFGLRGESGAVIVPLVATQILWINLITDSGPALAMGVDPATGDLMGRGPRRTTDRIIDKRMWGGILGVGAVMAAVTLLTFDYFLPGGLFAGTDSVEVARTAAFTTLVFAQLFNTFNSRSDELSAFTRIFTNGWLWASLALGVVLQWAVVELPFFQAAFSTAALDLRHWAISVGMASVVLWYDELRKAVTRARAASGKRGGGGLGN
ncbi:cation-translocating P-type ATPase [Buchananella felis]|uniref:cation-translocating P-type ATPase n=1 Tax=Buchananella felis TaxID=3231492 RepID=UPI003527081C